VLLLLTCFSINIPCQPPDVVVFEVLKSEPRRHTRVDVLAICSVATDGLTAPILTSKDPAKDSSNVANSGGSGSIVVSSKASSGERVIEMWVDLCLDDDTTGTGAVDKEKEVDSGTNRMMQLHARIEWVKNATD
jgi:hypothetical protein